LQEKVMVSTDLFVLKYQRENFHDLLLLAVKIQNYLKS